MDKGRQLLLDGLDALRDELDKMAITCDGWQFMMGQAPEPHPFSAIMVHAYNKDLKQEAGLVIYEQHVMEGQSLAMLSKLEDACIRAGGYGGVKH